MGRRADRFSKGQPVRIISLGCPVPSPNVDNHSIANAPSLFDYDACIIDMQAVSEQIEGIAASTLNAKAPDGRAVSAGESGAFHFGLAELLELRQFEFRQLLDNGGILVLFVYPNVRHPGVASFPGLNRYSLIPSPDGDPFTWPTLRPGDGKDVQVTAPQHPASGFLADLSNRIRYRAMFDLPASSKGEVVGRSIGGAAVAAEFRVGPGRIVALPPTDNLATAQRKAFSASLLEMIERLVEEPDLAAAPVWVRRYDSPEASAARDELAEAEAELKQSERRVKEAQTLVADSTRFEGMLWQSDNASFRETVHDAFRVLGYSVAGAEGSTEIRDGAETALLELVSAANAVSDRLYLTLQQRVEEYYLRRRARPKGIIVGNGHRQTDPRIRREPFPKALVEACETFGYALIPVEALYELVTFAGEAVDEPEILEEIRRSIAETAGVLEVSLEEEPEEGENDASSVAVGNGAVAATSEFS